MKLEEAKKLKNVFKSNLHEISKGRYKSEEQESALKILNWYTNYEKLLLNYLMIILQLSLRLNKKQNMEVSKSLTPKQTLQRLPIALALVKAGNTPEKLLNEVRQIIHSLCRAKEVTTKVYNNILISIKV